MSWRNQRWWGRFREASIPVEAVLSNAVESVQIVNDARYLGSREGSPWGRAIGTEAANGVGIHSFVEIVGDVRGNSLLVLDVLFSLSTALSVVSFALVDPASVTFDSRAAASANADLPGEDGRSVVFNKGGIATANLPTALGVLPIAFFQSSTPVSVQKIPAGPLGFALEAPGPQSFIAWAGVANSALNYDLQGMLVKG